MRTNPVIQKLLSDKKFAPYGSPLWIAAPGAVKIAALKMVNESVPRAILRVVPTGLKDFEIHNNWYSTAVPMCCQQ